MRAFWDWAQRRSSLSLAIYAGLVYLFFYTPIAIVVAYSFNDSRFVSVWGGFTTHWYGDALSDSSILDALRTTLIVAVASTCIAVVIGTITAYYLERTGPRVRLITDSVTYMRIILPEIVSALSLVIFFSIVHIPLGIVAIVIGHVAFNTAYVIVVVRARLAGMDRATEEAALDLGASYLTTFLRITLPELLPGVLAAALLAFTFSFDDFVTSFFLSGPGATTLPIKIYSMIRYGISPSINALSTCILLVTLTLLTLFGLANRAGQAASRR
ncbi:MAG TPA: ABC transporter permease [Chloroflexota bacterium]|nr:ABC transporter permease [Chloroflexota bacterium]